MRGLIILVIGLVLFQGTHMFITRRAWRSAVIARTGEWPYKGAIAVLSVLGIVLIGYGFGEYRATGWIDVWYPPRWTVYITQMLMWPASIFVVAAYSRGDIWRKLKHPMLIGVKTWAVAHLISNGDLGSIILFGSFLAWGGFHRMTLRTRSDRGAPDIPAGDRMRDWIAVGVGTLLYLALGFIFHPVVVGTPVFGRLAH
ncbi:MAG: NnrU family protein [Xanthobacteraceae bacterium]